MSEHAHGHTGNGTASAPAQPSVRRRTGPRKPATARPAFVVLQVQDENGQPVSVDKSRIRLLAVERNSDKVLELVDSGQHDHAFYLRGMIQPSR